MTIAGNNTNLYGGHCQSLKCKMQSSDALLQMHEQNHMLSITQQFTQAKVMAETIRDFYRDCTISIMQLSKTSEPLLPLSIHN